MLLAMPRIQSISWGFQELHCDDDVNNYGDGVDDVDDGDDDDDDDDDDDGDDDDEEDNDHDHDHEYDPVQENSSR